jgi:hypothetical protein
MHPKLLFHLNVNSLIPMGADMRPFFNELHAGLVTFPNFVREMCASSSAPIVASHIFTQHDTLMS